MAMGTLYYYGARGLPRDQPRALGYFERAADLGAPEGCVPVHVGVRKRRVVVVASTCAHLVSLGRLLVRAASSSLRVFVQQVEDLAAAAGSL